MKRGKEEEEQQQKIGEKAIKERFADPLLYQF
jgi:hypothetical protein